MNLNIAICDDEPEAISILQKHLTTLSFDLDLNISIDTFSFGRDLLNAISNSSDFPYQLLLLDVEISDENGIDIARSLYRNMPSDSFIVFVSSYPKYMQDSFSVHPYSYLTKPVLMTDLKKVMIDITERYKKDRGQIMFVTDDGRDVSLPVKNITYIQGTDPRNREVTVYAGSEIYVCRGSLIDLEHSYPDTLFRLNRTTIVNLLNIHYLKDDKVMMNTGIMLTASIRSKRHLVRLLQNNPDLTR